LGISAETRCAAGLAPTRGRLGPPHRSNRRFGVQIRAEAFNLTNRPQYGNPSANISAPANFGLITSIVNGGATRSGRSRSLQFMVRLEF
jgi:hypothetical protein